MRPARRGRRASEPDQELEHERVLAEDAREEAAAALAARDAARADAAEARRELERLRGEACALAARVEELSARLAEHETAQHIADEEMRVAFEELQTSAEELEEANAALSRNNDDLERQVSARTAELAAAADRLRITTDAVPNLVWASAPGGRWHWANRRWAEFTGMAEPESHGLGWLDTIHPDDRARTMDAWVEAEGAGELRVTHRIRRADGAWRWFSTHALPVRAAGEGRANVPGEWLGSCTDVDEARRTGDALRDSEARFRGFAENTPDVLWMTDARTGGLAYLSPAFETVWGEARERATGRDGGCWADALHPEDRERALALRGAALAGRRVDAEYRIRRHSDGAVRWIRDVAFPVGGAPGSGTVRFAAGVARDITERKDAEERQSLLMRELDHRVKNALAVAQALAAQTARTADSPQDFAAAFTERLRAFGRAQDLLTRENGRGALLGDVVEATLAPHGGDGERVSLDGPPVRLSPAAVVTLHMVFHELATNAAKHGALSVPGGRVRVEWGADPGAGPRGGLAVTWAESGGPRRDGPPERQGFGTRLIRQAVPRQLGGEVELEFPPEGLRCRMCLPWSDQVRPEAT